MLSRKVSVLFRRNRMADELEEEMRLHRELAAAANRRFGNFTLLKEESMDMWRLSWLEDLVNDGRFALRWMRARPLFTGIIVLTLALGVGANTAIFSLANALLLRSLPVRDAAELHYVHILPQMPDGAGNTGSGESSFSYATYRTLREQRSAFTNVVAYVPLGFNKIPIRVGSVAEEAAVQMVSGDFFSALGVRLTCGTGFRAADEDTGASLAVIGHGLWNRNFGGSCSALGKTIFIKGLPFTLVGVAPEAFRGVDTGAASDVWIPLQKRPELNAWGVTVGSNNLTAGSNTYRVDVRWWCLRLLARVPTHLDPSQAARNALPGFLRTAYEPLGGKPHPGEQPRLLKLIPARGLGNPDLEKPLFTLMGMVALVLVIACTNIAMLLVARNASRRRELGIRLALGGGQGRLFRQLLVESLLLVFGGASVGFLLAWRATGLLAKWAELDASLAPDWTVLLFTLGISVLISVLFGLIPFLSTGRATLTTLLSQGSQATAFSGRSRGRLRQLVLVCQVALGFALIAGAGLLTRSLRMLEDRNLGFAAEKLLVFGLNAPANASVGKKNALFFNSIVDRLKQLPGVIEATYVENRPGSTWSDNTSVWVDGRTDHKGAQNGSNMMRFNGVGPDYFRTAGIPVRQGRDISRADSHNAAKVAVVNESFAKEFFPGRSALGHHVSFTGQAAFTVVGVVADNVYADLHEQAQPMAWCSAGTDGHARHARSVAHRFAASGDTDTAGAPGGSGYRSQLGFTSAKDGSGGICFDGGQRAAAGAYLAVLWADGCGAGGHGAVWDALLSCQPADGRAWYPHGGGRPETADRVAGGEREYYRAGDRTLRGSSSGGGGRALACLVAL